MERDWSSSEFYFDANISRTRNKLPLFYSKYPHQSEHGSVNWFVKIKMNRRRTAEQQPKLIYSIRPVSPHASRLVCVQNKMAVTKFTHPNAPFYYCDTHQRQKQIRTTHAHNVWTIATTVRPLTHTNTHTHTNSNKILTFNLWMEQMEWKTKSQAKYIYPMYNIIIIIVASN